MKIRHRLTKTADNQVFTQVADAFDTSELVTSVVYIYINGGIQKLLSDITQSAVNHLITLPIYARPRFRMYFRWLKKLMQV
jgi:hypothetical protein